MKPNKVSSFFERVKPESVIKCKPKNITFLALVSGDFWSHNKEKNEFVVSPEPDVSSFLLDLESMRCLVVGSDGLWDMVGPRVAVDVVHGLGIAEKVIQYPKKL